MHKIKESLPALAVIAVLLAAWWLMVIETHSVIFPTPWQVVTGTLELIKDGTLWSTSAPR
jgi:NitT/TauT family transport system permease protein